MRKFFRVLIALAGALPQAVMALAMGSIDVRSGLNEPFSADVELIAVRPGDLRNITVGLAPNADFRRAGIQRTHLLTRLRFKIAKRSDGTPVIQITSERAITETYLDFLLEVNRPNGRLLREYTVLLDPPEIARAAPTPPPAVSRPTRRASATPPAQPRRRPIPPPAVAATAPGVDVYGPTRRNDTLWDIAKQVRPDRSVSMHQVMIALQRSNPDAFRNGNVNNLKAGYSLTVPSRQDMLALGRSEASREFSYQYEEWKAARAGRAPPSRPDSLPIQPRLTLTTPEPRPPVVQPAPTEPGAAPGPAAHIDQERDLALERAHTAEQQVLELNRRQSEMEQRLARLEQLLTLKDADIAALQARIADRGDATPAPTEPPGDFELEAPLSSEEPIAAIDPTPAEETDGTTEPAEPEPAVAMPTSPADDATSPMPAEPAPTRVSAPSPAAGGTLLDHPLFTPVLLALLVLLLGSAYWLMRKRRAEAESEPLEPGEAEQPLATEAHAETQAPPAGNAPAPAKADMLTEVELAIAYGQYQQAEDLLRRALTLEPSRIDLQEKLLEVYFATDNRPGFDTLAGQFYASIGHDDQHPLWKRVSDMGRKMFPGNPLFAGAKAQQPPKPSATVATGAAAAGAAALGAAAARAEPSPPPAPPSDSGAGRETGGEEFDLGFLDQLDESPTAPAPAPAPAAPAPREPERQAPQPIDTDQTTNDLEDELRRLELELGGDEPSGEDLIAAVGGADRGLESSPEASAGEADLGADLEGLDLSWMDEQPKETPKTVAAPTTDRDAMTDMDFDLSGLEAAAKQPPAAAPRSADLDKPLDFELGDTSFGEPPAGTGTTGEEEIDEIGTKLELAQAYIDMGDPVSAREILEEVLREGDADRKREAEALIRTIS